MRITVKYLQEQLEESQKNANRCYQQWQEAKNELQKKEELDSRFFLQERNYKDEEINRLMEIIHILSKDPRLELIEDTHRFQTK